jgi:uncharacterized integral membrane protein
LAGATAMKSFLKWLVILPIAAAIVIFAMLNRQWVHVDPDMPSLAFDAPLFAIMFACGALGVIAGSFSTWIGQGRHRRAAREARAEVARLKAQMPAPASLGRPGTQRAA